MRRLFKELIVSEGGQDVVEYALLTAGIGLAGAATWPILVNVLGVTYAQFGTNAQGLWEPPPPTK